MDKQTDAQKKEIEAEEPLADLTPTKDATGGRASTNPALDAQKKEIEDI